MVENYVCALRIALRVVWERRSTYEGSENGYFTTEERMRIPTSIERKKVP